MRARPFRELDDGELIAMALGGGTRCVAMRDVAARLAQMPRWECADINEHDLARRYGIDVESATRAAAIWALAERWHPDDRPVITSPRDALLLLERLRSARREEVVAVMVDARHRPIGVETVVVGSVNASRLQPRDVFMPAVRASAVAVIIGHNHPSGEASPSRSDRVVTAALRAAGELLGITVLDHLIVTRSTHFSFREAEQWDPELAA